MANKPILFSAPMVRAILEGRKTQTRRVIDWENLHRQAGLDFPTKCRLAHFDILDNWGIDAGGDCMREVNAPYRAGDTLWVRENFYVQPELWRVNHDEQPVHYAADTPRDQVEDYIQKPSIHMPRWAARIHLKVNLVRVERVQDISDADAKAEGVESMSGNFPLLPETRAMHYQAFAYLWNSINEKRGFGWDTNPWVWVYEFEQLKQEEADGK